MQDLSKTREYMEQWLLSTRIFTPPMHTETERRFALDEGVKLKMKLSAGFKNEYRFNYDLYRLNEESEVTPEDVSNLLSDMLNKTVEEIGLSEIGDDGTWYTGGVNTDFTALYEDIEYETREIDFENNDRRVVLPIPPWVFELEDESVEDYVSTWFGWLNESQQLGYIYPKESDSLYEIKER